MKVFLSGTSLLTAYGGPAYSVSRLATALADEGIEVGLWAPDGSATTTSLVVGSSGVRRLSGSLSEALEECGRPDVIHDNGLWLRHNHQIAVVAAKRGIPRVVSTRGMLEPWAMNHKKWKKRVAWPLYQKRDLMRASVIHATTERESEGVARLGLGVPIKIIPNGVDLPDIGSAPQRDSTIRTALFLGRIYPVKGLPMLIAAWAEARPLNWRLVIAGPDEAGHLDEVLSAVKRAGLEDVVSFAGPLEGERKRNALMEAELFVLPSYSESFGMSIAEALSYGLPVLTTTATPWEALVDRNCGWRALPTASDLSGALRVATSSGRSILREMGGRGRQLIAEEFSWKPVGAEFAKVYREAGGRK